MNTICAIDIGGTKVIAAIAEIEDSQRVRIIGVGSQINKGVKRGVVVDLDLTTSAISEAKEKAEAMASCKLTQATVGVTGEHLESTPSKGLVPILNPGRSISREDVNRVLNHSKQIVLEPERELILAVPRHYRVDGNNGVRKPYGMSGERLEVESILVTGSSSQLDNLDKCLKRANVAVDTLIPQVHASGIAVTKQEERDRGVIVIDVGGSTTDFAIYREGSLAAIGMVPVGGQHITNDISVLLKTSTEDAERIKVEHGTCLPGEVDDSEAVEIRQMGVEAVRPFSRKVLAEIIAARVREICKLVLSAAQKHTPIANLRVGAVVTGGGSQIHGLTDLVEATLESSAKLGKTKKLPGLGDMLSGPEGATIVGLIQYAFRSRDDEPVTAETGDWRKVLKSIGSIFAGKPREDGR